MPDQPPSPELTQTRRERDLYRRLLDLGEQNELEPFLREALALVVEVIGARQGYLELHDDQDRAGGQPWCIAHGFSAGEVEGIRAAISRGIIAHALATGQTIVTPSALLDPRFRERDSVRMGRIEAVVCAPIGSDPPLGVLYLQGREEPGAFSEEDRSNAELFSRHLAPLAERLLARRRSEDNADATRVLRRMLRLEGVIGRSAGFAAALQQVALVAPLEVSVLLTGENGTGKSQLARIIHDNGPRRNGPFVEVNCAALPEALAENELFGHEPEAFTGATKRKEGKVAAAERGTLVLDEVAELSSTVQAKLLQVLQSRHYYPLQASKPVKADVRVIAATNADLRAAIVGHRFREDLYYRLEVLPIRVPSLAERREDIPELAAHFCASACERHRLARVTLSPGAVRVLQSGDWPGNVRQLAHAVEAAVIRASGSGAERVEARHLLSDSGAAARQPLTFQDATRRFQERLLRETLEECGWNIVDTANRLDLARSHVYNLIRVFALQRQK